MRPHLKNDLLYLLRILDAVEKIKLYVADYAAPEEFFEVNHGKEFNASLMLLTQIGEQSAKVSKDLKEKYAGVNWRELKDFRNRAVHDYSGLDRFLTFEIITVHVPLLKDTLSFIIQKEIEQGNFDKEEFEVAQTSQYLQHVDFIHIQRSK